MKNLLLKKSFLKLSVFVSAFSSMFSNCNPVNVNAAVYIWTKDVNTKIETLSTTYTIDYSEDFNRDYYAPKGKIISKIKFETSNKAPNTVFLVYSKDNPLANTYSAYTTAVYLPNSEYLGVAYLKTK